MPLVAESSCALCGGVFKTIYGSVMLYTSKDGEKNMFYDDITFITLSKSSDLL